MLSKLLSSPLAAKHFGASALKSIRPNTLIVKRWSGHNNMDIGPSKIDNKFLTNWIHFYVLLGGIPAVVLATIVNLRANPELSEVPDGYEPRHWEYHKSPITRWIARYLTTPDEFDREMILHHNAEESENQILRKIIQNVEAVMTFYNDHRTMNFIPTYGEYIRSNRDEADYIYSHVRTERGELLDKAYDPEVNILPTEGYLAGPPDKN